MLEVENDGNELREIWEDSGSNLLSISNDGVDSNELLENCQVDGENGPQFLGFGA